MSAAEARTALAKAGYRPVRGDGLSSGPSFAAQVRQQAERRRTGNYVAAFPADRVVTGIDATGPNRESLTIHLAALATGSSAVVAVDLVMPSEVMTGPALLRQAVAKCGRPDGGRDLGLTLAWCSAPARSVCGALSPFGVRYGSLPNLVVHTAPTKLISLGEGTERGSDAGAISRRRWTAPHRSSITSRSEEVGMGILIGAVFVVALLVGLRVLNASGFFEALPLLLLLAGLSFTAFMLVRANFDPAWARTAAVAAPAGVLAWAAWHPALSHRKLWVMEGAEKLARTVTWLSLLACALTLPANGFRLGVWVWREWPWAAAAGVAWAVGRLSHTIVVRSGARNLAVFEENLRRLDGP